MSLKNNQIIEYPRPELKRTQIANRINALHFRNDPILVILRHRAYDYTLSLKAFPDVCHGVQLTATWDKTLGNVPRNLHQYQLEKVLIPGIANTLEIKTEKALLETDRLQVELPDHLTVKTSRTIHRYMASEVIQAEMTQHTIRYTGQLIDCSAEGLRLRMRPAEEHSGWWFQENRNVTLTLYRNDQIVFSGPVHILRNESSTSDNRTVVVLPMENQTPIYQPRDERTKRVSIQPTPDAQFIHPLNGLKTTLTVCDIASLGISVYEKSQQATLIPGLILDQIELRVFGTTFMRFTGQVVYRHPHGDQSRCGIAILNISVEEHSRLIGLVHQAENENSYVRLNSDPEKFFEFLFDTGFLYPSKYEDVNLHRDAFVSAYRKLYLNDNQIAKCFVYLENGDILGHVSTLRIYRHTWLDHHHAALSKNRSGLRVLRQVSDFHNDVHVLNPWQMRYVAGIWRPDNEFPAKVFGRLATKLDNPAICSTDTFSYFKSTLASCKNWDDLNGPWSIEKACQQDVNEFNGFYKNHSGGLLAEAFDLTEDTFNDQSIAKEYARSGLKRERHLYAVRYGLDLKALVDVQDSDTGLNLSELTNAVYLYVLDTQMVTPRILEFIQCVVSVKHQRESLTIMLYPHTYAQRYPIKVAKDYTVWLIKLDSEGLGAYMKHLSRWCK